MTDILELHGRLNANPFLGFLPGTLLAEEPTIDGDVITFTFVVGGVEPDAVVDA